MSLNHYITEIKRGLQSPVYLLYGNSHFLLKEALFITYSIVPEGNREFCLDVFDMEEGDRHSIDDIVDIMNTIPFLGGKRFIIIENAQSMKQKELSTINNYISNPSPYSVLVLLYLGKLKDDFKKLSQKIRSISVDVRPQDIPSWTKEKALQKGIELTDGSIDYLIGITGQDIGLISSELEKLALLGKKQVDVTDISSLIKSEGDFDVFDLIEALKRKNKVEAFRVLKKLLDLAEPYSILGALNWYFNRLIEESKLKDSQKIFSLLHETDFSIKVSGGRYPLEYFLIRLLQP